MALSQQGMLFVKFLPHSEVSNIKFSTTLFSPLTDRSAITWMSTLCLYSSLENRRTRVLLARPVSTDTSCFFSMSSQAYLHAQPFKHCRVWFCQVIDKKLDLEGRWICGPETKRDQFKWEQESGCQIIFVSLQCHKKTERQVNVSTVCWSRSPEIAP